MKQIGRRWMAAKVVAAHIGFSLREVLAWCRSGEIRAHQVRQAGRWRIYVDPDGWPLPARRKTNAA